jgi:hypothetical protein
MAFFVAILPDGSLLIKGAILFAFIVAFIVVFTTLPAGAAPQQRIVNRYTVTKRYYVAALPPSDYDVPYKGDLTITRVPSEDAVRAACPNMKPSPSGRAIACAKLAPRKQADLELAGGAIVPYPQCNIIVVYESIIQDFGSTMAFILRHELAHCNGWSEDHPGGKKVPVSTKVKMPTLPEDTKWPYPDESKPKYQMQVPNITPPPPPWK